MSNAVDQYDKYVITSMLAGIEPLVIERATGSTIYTEDGKEYLDCFSGISVTNAGHSHPRIIAAAKEQMEKLVHCCTYVYYNPAAAAFAGQLASVLPGTLQKSFFGNSGAEAIEGAMRLAKQHTGRCELIALNHSFHGRTVGTLSITGNMTRKKGGGPYLSGVAFAPAPYVYRCPFKTTTPDDCAAACAEAFEQTIRHQTSGNVAAFIAEPVMGEGGIIVPPDNYFTYVKEICDRYGILFIADEVQSGFGRCGSLFAIEHYNVEPDILVSAKGIANGFPLSAFSTRPDIADAFNPGDHLSTFGGNPVSCAAASANLEVLVGENLIENAVARGEQIMQALQQLSDKYALIGDVRGRGLMIGVELVKDEIKSPAADEAGAVRRLCREAGVLIGVGGTFGNVIRIQPPLCITEEEVRTIVNAIDVTLSVVSGHAAPAHVVAAAV